MMMEFSPKTFLRSELFILLSFMYDQGTFSYLMHRAPQLEPTAHVQEILMLVVVLAESAEIH